MLYNIERCKSCKRPLAMLAIARIGTEMYSRGRRGAPAKGVGRVTVARVQISPSPPIKKPPVGWFFYWRKRGDLKSSDRERERDKRRRWRKKRRRASEQTRSIAPEGSRATLFARCNAAKRLENLSISANKKTTRGVVFLLAKTRRFEIERPREGARQAPPVAEEAQTSE